jgi:transcriptional regulator GlxA family with amidase domain
MSYLRNVRLDHCRRLLVAGTASVTDVAQQCGFTHLGRFSAAYKERFGELPSHTLTGLDVGD